MGYYYGTATRFKVAKSTPLPALEFIDKFFLEQDCSGAFGHLATERVSNSTALAFPIPEDMIDDIDYMSFMLGGCNPEFALWWWRVKEDCGDHWLYETRGSCKHPREEFLAKVFEWIGPALIVEDGDILFRVIGEDAASERIHYWRDGAVVERPGFDYYNHLPDGSRGDGYYWHPSNIHLDRWDEAVYAPDWEQQRKVRQDEWLPGWTCHEVYQLMGREVGEEIYGQTTSGVPTKSKRNKPCKNEFRPGLNKPKRKKSR